MRPVFVCLLAMAAILTGCAPEPDQRVVRPEGWIWADVLREAPPLPENCPVPAELPQQAQVELIGLDHPMAWLPGHVHFGNVRPNEAGQGPVQISLNRSGTDGESYTREVAGFEPTLIQFPGPGCWDLKVEHAGGEKIYYLRVEPALPTGFAVVSASGFESESWGDTELAMRVFDEVARNPMPHPWDRRGVNFEVIWTTESGMTWPDTALYFPSIGETPAMLALPASRFTGNCEDNDRPQTGMLSGEVAALFAELATGGQTALGLTTWSQRAANCLAFEHEQP